MLILEGALGWDEDENDSDLERAQVTIEITRTEKSNDRTERASLSQTNNEEDVQDRNKTVRPSGNQVETTGTFWTGQFVGFQRLAPYF